MSAIAHVKLTPSEIERISSPYLQEGRKQESWRIDEVEVDGDRLNAIVSMRSFYSSATDAEGFHLSYITALEFLSQLQIIYMHVWAGLAEKTQEAWMAECRMRAHRPLRNPNRMRAEMRAVSMRRRGQACYCIAEHTLTDDQGGLFEVWIKALMS
jgi:hypothetical protein